MGRFAALEKRNGFSDPVETVRKARSFSVKRSCSWGALYRPPRILPRRGAARMRHSIRFETDGASSEADHVVTWHPWHLQIQEQDVAGSWYMLFSASFMRRSEALGAAAKMGADVDYVSHHDDSVESVSL